MKKQSTVLYRYFAESGELLYVGISKSFANRAQQHNQGSTWFHESVSVTLEHFETREAALRAETQAIKNEKPVYNSVHNKGAMKNLFRKTVIPFSMPNDSDQRRELITSLMTSKGGWKRDDLAKLGVPWPPPKGWRSRLIDKGYITK